MLKEICVDKNKEAANLEKYVNYYILLDYWMQAMEREKLIEEFFLFRGYKKIAIYGIAALGKHLIAQLKDSEIEVIYTIDRMVVDITGKLLSESVNEIPAVDAVIVTPVYDYSIIKDDLRKYVNCDILSLEEVVLSL